MNRFIVVLRDLDTNRVTASPILEKETLEDVDEFTKCLIRIRYEGQLRGLRNEFPIGKVEVYQVGATHDLTDKYKELWTASVEEEKKKYLKEDRETKYKQYLELKKIFEKTEDENKEANS